MPKSFSEYELNDWLRLRPLLHHVKTARYRIVDRLYLRLSPRAGDVPDITRRMRGQRVLITVAFRDPEAIAWQAQLLRRFVPQALYFILQYQLSTL